MCGSVMLVKVCHPDAPSTWAASITSPGRDCRPASRISVMNGVHCQISSNSTARRGNWVSQSTRGPPTRASTPLKNPELTSNIR